MEITVAIILATLSVLIGVMTNELAWCLLAGTAVWIGLQYAEFRKLRDWSRRPFSRPTETLTSWFSLAYEPFRMLTGERERTRRITSRGVSPYRSDPRCSHYSQQIGQHRKSQHLSDADVKYF